LYEESDQSGAEIGIPGQVDLRPMNRWAERFGRLLPPVVLIAVALTGATRFLASGYSIDNSIDWYGVAIFIGNCAMISWLVVSGRRNRARNLAARSDARRAEAVMARYQLISRHSRDPLLLITMDGRIVEGNNAAVDLYGYDHEELLRLTIQGLRRLDDPETVRRQMEETQSAGILFEAVHVRKDGSTVPVEVSSRRVFVEGEAMLLSVIRDITARKQREATLRESEARFRAAVDNYPGEFRIYDKDRRYRFTNKYFHRMTGVPEGAAVGHVDEEILPPEFWERYLPALDRVLATGEPQRLETAIDIKGGGRFDMIVHFIPHLDEHGRVREVYGISHDVTELRRLGEQLQHSHRLETVGKLAAGIAHEFNNMMIVVTGYSDLLATGLPKDSPLRQQVGEIKIAGERAASLTRQLLAFSRKQMLQPKVMELNGTVERIHQMLHRLLGDHIDLEMRLSSGVWRVIADPAQIEQVIVNLAVNARDAMPRGGTLVIETGNVRLEKNSRDYHAEMTPGRYVLLSVSDNGVGMDPATRERIFDPFFTTKDVGKGTGLGLSMVYGTVKQTGGYIYVDSEPEGGTIFKIFLPCAPEEGAEEEEDRPPEKTDGGAETILVVEDEAAVRALLKAMLEIKGYSVLEASGGEEALALCQGQESPVNLLLTDVMMPGMSGQELADRIADRHPGLKTLFVSALSENQAIRQGMLKPGGQFLQKPFQSELLARNVRALLEM
jgi:two-component system cell cycle sensor histidine kinase/response regulator CckA